MCLLGESSLPLLSSQPSNPQMHPPQSPTAEHTRPRAEAGGILTGIIQGIISGLPRRRKMKPTESQVSLHPCPWHIHRRQKRNRTHWHHNYYSPPLCQIIGAQRASSRAPSLMTFLTPSRGPGHQLPSVESCWVNKWGQQTGRWASGPWPVRPNALYSAHSDDKSTGLTVLLTGAFTQ